MNKKIVLSLATIAVAGAAVIGGTIAQFTDTEDTTGTFTTGTIDIAIDGQNPWTETYNTGDLKPGQTGYINFDIQNVGENGAKVFKKLSDFNESTGLDTYTCATKDSYTEGQVSSEPECVEAQANGSDKNDVQSKIIYDLYVEVYEEGNSEKIWWQTIYTDGEGKTLDAVYGGGGEVELGTIPAGGHMMVKQSYHFDDEAGNEYQGDQLSFTMTIRAEQLPQGDEGKTTVVMENKVQGEGDIWNIIEGDNIDGVLEYVAAGSLFDYELTASVKTTGNYTLLYVGPTNNYPCTDSVILGTAEFTALTDKTISNQVDIGADISNGKIWLIPSASYNDTIMTSWPADDILFETGMINYDDTDI